MTAGEAYFAWKGGAVRLVDPVTDPIIRHIGWGHAEKDEFTLPFGPWSFSPAGEADTLSAGPWVYRYGTAAAGTGSSYRAIATRVHADIGSREGGPIIVTLLSPWTAAYTFADEGYLDEGYVQQKLCRDYANPDDIRAVTQLVRMLLGRMEGFDGQP